MEWCESARLGGSGWASSRPIEMEVALWRLFGQPEVRVDLGPLGRFEGFRPAEAGSSPAIGGANRTPAVARAGVGYFRV